MNDKALAVPFYAKASLFLVGFSALVTMLYVAQSIIVPLVFSVMIAIVLHPIVNYFVSKKINRVVAIVLTMFITFIIIATVGILIISQASQFVESWPKLFNKFTLLLNQSIVWTSGYFDIPPLYINDWLNKTKNELIHINSAVLSQTLVKVGSGIVVLLLIPFYVFIVLYYKSLLLEFIHRVFSTNSQTKVSEIITQTKMLIQKYLSGLVIEFLIIAVLNTIVLFALGIDYAILLGVIGALLNVIPYVGGLVGVALPMIVALATKPSPWYAIYILIIYYIIQLIDNNYIVPVIVSSKVKINALFSIVIVIAGNAMWGMSGMFLAIPLLAILKLIFDQTDSLKPWGFLLGDTMPDKHSRK